MAVRITVRKKGNEKDFIRDIRKKMSHFDTGVEIFIRRTANYMARRIREGVRRKPSTGRLANSIKSYVTFGGNVTVADAGRKSDLPGYWAAVNYGGIIPGGGKFVRGSFDGERPDAAFAGVPGGDGVRFKGDNRRRGGMRAKHFIHPMNYIEKTQAWFRLEWPTYIGNRMRKK